MVQQRHLIKQQILDLRVGSKIPAVGLQNQLSALYRNQVIPLIDAYCNQLSDPDAILRIDTLDIDLGEIDIQNLEKEFVEKVIIQLPQQLAEKLGSSALTQLTGSIWRSTDKADTETQGHRDTRNTAAISAAPPDLISPSLKYSRPFSQSMGAFPPPPPASDPNQPKSDAKQQTQSSFTASQLELVSYFIQTGRLPWWCDRLSKTELENCCNRLLLDAPVELKTLLLAQLKQEKKMRRIIYQFSDTVLLKFAELFSPASSQPLQQYNHDIRVLYPQVDCFSQIPPTQFRQTLWQGIFLNLSQRQASSLGADAIIRGSLLHVATHFNVNYRSLIQQMPSAVDYLRAEGVSLGSELPSVFAAHPQPRALKMADVSIASARFRVAVDNLVSLLSALKNLNQEHSIRSLLSAKLDPLLGQLNSLRDSSNEPSNSLLPILSVNTLLTEIEALVVELEEEAPRVDPPLTRQIKAVVQSIKPQARSSKIPSPPEPFDDPVDPFSESEEIYIQNAGLILLWPFLTRFFETLNLLQVNQFTEPQANKRAVLLLQYLVDTSTEIPEHLLPLNKLLCGLNLLDPIEASLDITASEQTECNSLLLAVIHHWSALKSTTPAGFRHAFLQRAGILRLYNGYWLLQAERETYDVLLDQLPWSIRVVKLPWTPEMLSVEW